MTLYVGDVVEWNRWPPDGVGRGVVSRIEKGRVYVKLQTTNTRGKKRTRTIEVWFDPHETRRLRKVTT